MLRRSLSPATHSADQDVNGKRITLRAFSVNTSAYLCVGIMSHGLGCIQRQMLRILRRRRSVIDIIGRCCR
jgi:hypothetical protein